MKNKSLIAVSISLLLGASPVRADLFDWIPLPKFSFDDILDAVEDAFDFVGDVIIDPVANFGKDTFDSVLSKLVEKSVIRAEVKQRLLEKIDQKVDDTYGILVTPASFADADATLTVFSDPVTGIVVFQDTKNTMRYNVEGIESVDLPAMGFYDGQSVNQSLVEPRGLATDYQGTFWVADARSGKIQRIQYQYINPSLQFAGVIGGFDQPHSVAFSPGATAVPDDDLLYVANTGANSLCSLNPWFTGDGSLASALEYRCLESVGGVAFSKPLAVAVEHSSQPQATGNPLILYLAFGDNRIAKLQEGTGGLELLGVTEVGSTDSRITGLATDRQGLLYAVDNVHGKVHYFSSEGSQLLEIFAFGEPGTGSTAQSIKFNHPKMIATFGTEVFVSEQWTGQSGIQRFKAFPTVDRSNTEVTLTPDASTVDWKITISQTADVVLELEFCPNPADLGGFVQVFTSQRTVQAGTTTFSFPFKGNTGAFNGSSLAVNGLYRFRIKVFSPVAPSVPSDIYSRELVLSTPSSQPEMQVQMKENASPETNSSQPEIILTNLSSSPVQGFIVRFWLSREEMSSQIVEVDRYWTNPEHITISTGHHPRNPNLIYADFRYPSGFVLNPGSSTLDQGFRVGFHFRNYWPGQWNRNNDFTWQDITAAYSVTRNVTILSADGRILHGNWPEVLDPPAPPAPAPSRHPVLGFENVTDWSAPQALLSANTTSRTEGDASLSIEGGGWLVVSSTDMGTGGITDETSTLALDVFVPGTQPNPWWLGTLSLLANCPSAGLNNAFLGHIELTPLPQGQFSTVTFTVTQEVLTALQGEFNDFSLQFEINVNTGAPPLLLDHLRFVP